jgi:protein TonB
MPWKASGISGVAVDLTPGSLDSDQLLALAPLNSLPIAARAIAAPSPMADVSDASNRPPTPLLRPAPAYPKMALQSGVTGDVVLRLFVSSKGDVYKVKVLTGSTYLADAAESAVKRWKYSPAMSNGSPVKSETLATLRFLLR